MNNKENKVFMEGCTDQELAIKIAEMVVDILKPLLPEKSDTLLSRKDAAAMLNISTQTLDKRAKAGLIQEVRIGKKIQFKTSEIKRAMLVIRKYRI